MTAHGLQARSSGVARFLGGLPVDALASKSNRLNDSVSLLPETLRTDPEAVSRQEEIKDEALYGLDLREQAAPFQPVWLNPLTNGVHGVPVKTDNPTLLLIN